MKTELQKRKALRPALLLLTVLMAFALASPAWAELGGRVESVRQDGSAFHAQPAVTQAAAHSVYEMKLADGSRVREYVSNSGTVFGVSWITPMRPDLKRLLGSYFSQYSAEMQKTQKAHIRRGPVVIHTDGLVVELAGHVRGFTGHAYVSSLIPAGVTANDIR